jgi:hypothetical protein
MILPLHLQALLQGNTIISIVPDNAKSHADMVSYNTTAEDQASIRHKEEPKRHNKQRPALVSSSATTTSNSMSLNIPHRTDGTATKEYKMPARIRSRWESELCRPSSYYAIQTSIQFSSDMVGGPLFLSSRGDRAPGLKPRRRPRNDDDDDDDTVVASGAAAAA